MAKIDWERFRWSYVLMVVVFVLFPLFLDSSSAQNRAPPLMSPFFFFCSYHGNQDQSNLGVGEVALSVFVDGNPNTYVPGREYRVTIASNRNFDGFLLTGLYTLSTDVSQRLGLNAFPSLAISSMQPFGHGFICSLIHSKSYPSPQQQLSFIWTAPEKGTGCISFLATATLKSQLLFKDATVLQLCEDGATGKVDDVVPKLASVGEDGILFRDDFDSSPTFHKDLWNSTEGVAVGAQCGVVLHGNSAAACNASAKWRLLGTIPLNLTTAAIIQFAIASGKCNNVLSKESEISLDYGENGCTNWTTIELISSPRHSGTEIHFVHLPESAQHDDVCLRWLELPDKDEGDFGGCWAMDNILITNAANPPRFLAENFDPVNPSNFMFYPGGKIQISCLSDNNAIFFGDNENQIHNFVTTRDLNLKIDSLKPLFEETFDHGLTNGWITDGGEVGQKCSILHYKMSAVFYKADKTRRLCTPPLDLRQAGSLRFKFLFGSTKCSKFQSNAKKSRVFVYVEDDFGHWESLTTIENRGGFNEPKTVLVPIGPEGRGSTSRVCWTQKTHGGLDWDVWAVDLIEIFSVKPSHPEMFIQFSMTMRCTNSHSQDNTSVIVEASTNQGQNWFPLYEPCLAGKCRGTIDPLSSVFKANEFERWQRVTLPLPIHALSPSTRFRWRQESGNSSVWAIDNVYIGPCSAGCNGHGQCHTNSCVCDFGYRGRSCEAAQHKLPEMIMTSFDPSSAIDSSFSVMKGGSSSYDCGVVASGKPLVFNRNGQRMIQTVDLNTTNAWYLQFSIRVGSASEIGKCPAISTSAEEVLLQFTCDGGITWMILKRFSVKDYRQPIIVSFALPIEAQQSLCNFRWWQPAHSGQGLDVWAIDDISITNTIYNTISLDFANESITKQSIDVHLGNHKPYCGKSPTLSFTGVYEEGDTRYIITNMMHIGPSYVVQFELSMNCKFTTVPSQDGALYLEYSTDHGMKWDLVDKGCWPPATCVEYKPPTIYYFSEFQDWKRIVVILPPSTWSSSTRFRFRQEKWTASGSWALGSLYIGQQCPELCHGHGLCTNGQCLCDKGFKGLTCLPVTGLPKEMKMDFTLMSKLNIDWSEVTGGELVGANQGCGTILSGESLYFAKDSPRRAVTSDMDTSDVDFIQFYVQLGGEGAGQCFGIERRQENLLLQYSNNGGISWNLLKELHGPDFVNPGLVHVDLPTDAKTRSTRFHWWQPQHSGPELDQWALDEVIISKYNKMKQLEDDFEEKIWLNDQPEADESPLKLWLTVPDAMVTPYCGSVDDTLMFMGQRAAKFAITKDLDPSPNDVIQFRINVGCSKSFSFQHPVILQYSHDSGRTWSLVEKPCYFSDQCLDYYTDGSLYFPGPFGEWQTVVLHLSKEITGRRTNFRWWQEGGSGLSFAIDDVYIGPPCPEMCNGHGLCVGGKCKCDAGFTGRSCWGTDNSRSKIVDRFEDVNRPGPLWQKTHGGTVGLGCGVVGSGSSLYFDGNGVRQAVTIPVDTTFIKILQFAIRIGSRENLSRCRKPTDRREAVIVDYSTNNGIDWHILRTLDPFVLSDHPQVVTIKLPPAARTNSTSFRWWQPLSDPDIRPAEWALDDVMIAINESATVGFQDDFSSFQNDVWYTTMNAVPKITCHSRNNALEFSKNGLMRYAETWDYHVTSSTFLQFDIAMGCSGTYSTLYSIQLQYSIDLGRTWNPVIESCQSSGKDCSGYHLGSDFMSDTFSNWTRVTVYLPARAVSPFTRFRWLQETVTLRGNVWALDNIYLGEGCPWMCSGHGSCKLGSCVCDPGFTGEFCVPSVPLPMTLRDDFESGFLNDQWEELYGGDISSICDTVVSGKSLVFYKDNIRMVITTDLDVSMSIYMQFTFKYGCDRTSDWPKDHLVLIQYSTNGGILWKYLHRLHYPNNGEPRYFVIQLPTPAQTNATRFRFWQPEHDGHMKSIWTIDNILIGGSLMNPDVLYETFASTPNDEEWQFWPGGNIGEYCSFNTRADTLTSGASVMMFAESPGEHSITTRDININELSILQFDLNIGCTTESSKDDVVRLEYSTDYGKTWQLVVPPCSASQFPSCYDQEVPSTVYYPGTTPYWQRIIVPLTGISICGHARFRWTQGHYSPSQSSTVWALDSLYIGMQCKDHCNGHGMCIHGIFCQCDEGYEGELCTAAKQNPSFLKEDFDDTKSVLLDNSVWLIASGGNRTDKCGTLLSDKAMHFAGNGERMLTSNDLDLSHAVVIQFFIKIGCNLKLPPSKKSAEADNYRPVLLRFSTNGGIHWTILEQFDFNPHETEPRYVALNLPLKTQSNATRIQWWQPTVDGTHAVDWAIDQIYIGGNDNGNMVMQDNLASTTNDHWLMYPGAKIQATCGLDSKALLFAGPDKVRYAVTKDVTVTEFTYIQFYIMMGCHDTGRCYGIELQYSLDFGNTWQLVEHECLMAKDIDCIVYHAKSVLTSDVYFGWTRMTIKLPYYTRSKATRFRWIQPQKFLLQDSWAITFVYIGDECDCSCGGHGRCDRGKCLCDKGWTGSSCVVPLLPLPKELRESFTKKPNPDNWNMIVGGSLSKDCGILSSGMTMHMKGDCTRQLVTRDLDLQEAVFIQFHFRFGCTTLPTRKDEGVVVEYLPTGDGKWTMLMELYFDQYKNTSFINIDLPDAAKKVGVKIRWWQPTHAGQSRSDWAIDDIVIGGKEANPVELIDEFQSDNPNSIWLHHSNVVFGEYCGLPYVVIGEFVDKETVVLMTIDLAILHGYIIQFYISIGCNASWDDEIAPVELQFSTDYGKTWHLVVEECLPYYPSCDGRAATPSIYYYSKKWRRITIPLDGPAVSNATRFRWIQRFDSVPQKPLEKFSARQHWALDDVFIGPGCQDLCHGHGRCVFPKCLCDVGYGGPTCYQISPIQASLFETFDNEPVSDESWGLIQGGAIGLGCNPADDSQGLFFKGKGQRLAETIDLDLRMASYIKYHVTIGSKSQKIGCGAPSSRDDNVVLQYSSDGGITWNLLHLLDYDSYWRLPKIDYISLPADARTNATRFRWWQKIGSKFGPPAVAWIIDDIIIAGMDINPSSLHDTFDDGLNKDMWEFHPNGYLEENACGRKGMMMAWGEKVPLKMITTCQMIIQEGHMMQFKIVVGCNQDDYGCEKHQPVALEYNKDPTSDDWDVIYSQCLVSNQDANCRPHGFRQGTFYSASSHGTWTRVTINLPPKTFSSQTRFRWVQTNLTSSRASPDWSLDDVFISEGCPEMCRGRGDCIYGVCRCDPGYRGPTCEPSEHGMLSYMTEGFEGQVPNGNWEAVSGGSVGFGCGSLIPLSHGKNLYFNGCGIRQAVTVEMDLTKASKLMFVLQIGSNKQLPSCNIRLDNDSCNGKVILQYTLNKGVDWMLLAVHNPADFLSPKKLAYDIPHEARAVGVQLRWWQPEHRGQGFDQWAMDYVEIKMNHQDQMLRDSSGSNNYKDGLLQKKQSFYPGNNIRAV